MRRIIICFIFLGFHSKEKNGASIFQRGNDRKVKEENQCDAFPYIDNITITEYTQTEHDQNVKMFLGAITKVKITLNESKSVAAVHFINVLEYYIGSGVIKPEPERLSLKRDTAT